MRFGNWASVVLLVVAGCVKKPLDSQEALKRALAAADAAWESRTSTRYGPVIDALRVAASIDADSPEVMWRQARVELAIGIVEPDDRARRGSIGRARDVAWRCTLGDHGGDLLHEVGVARALAQVPAERAACLSWTYLAWTRWYAEFGAEAAALDRNTLDQLAVAGRALSGDNAERMRWGTALRSAAEGDDAPEWAQVQQDVAVVDRFRFIGARSGEAASSLDGLRMTTPEGRAYQSWLISR